MGAMPRLEKKVAFRYRKGHTNESENCKACAYFVPDFQVVGCDGKTLLGIEPRCRIFGLENSRRYRVRADYTCDRQFISQAWLDKIQAMRDGIVKRIQADMSPR